jgi:hypothetical protein
MVAASVQEVEHQQRMVDRIARGEGWDVEHGANLPEGVEQQG